MASPSSICKDRVTIDEPRAFVGGTYWWNYRIIRGLFPSPHGAPLFYREIDDAIAAAQRHAGRLIAWAARLEPRHEAECHKHGIDLVRIEDGFIRSVGLGAGCATSASLAVDSSGIYYDANRPSDLENLLEHTELTDDDRAAGNRIRQRIVELGLSKYNLGGKTPAHLDSGGRPIILVPGQVADDASIRNTPSSTIDIHADEPVNLQLLRAVRIRNPDAFLIYKPHPDVVHGLRQGAITDEQARQFANLTISDADISQLIGQCDTIETITSLAGFEGLLRGKSVTVHGLPFYAGWGLTNDLASTARRTAKRTIDELCYIAFTRYTRHAHPLTGMPCNIEELLDALALLRRSRLHRVRSSLLLRYAHLCQTLTANT